MITVNDAPIILKSSFQRIVACSTIEAEILALHHSCQELFPIMDMIEFLSASASLSVDPMMMQVSIHEDKPGALVLADMIPPQLTPRSKTYHVKAIWFQEEIKRQRIQLLKIDAIEELGILFTKALPTKTFEYLRKKLMGW